MVLDFEEGGSSWNAILGNLIPVNRSFEVNLWREVEIWFCTKIFCYIDNIGETKIYIKYILKVITFCYQGHYETYLKEDKNIFIRKWKFWSYGQRKTLICAISGYKRLKFCCQGHLGLLDHSQWEVGEGRWLSQLQEVPDDANIHKQLWDQVHSDWSQALYSLRFPDSGDYSSIITITIFIIITITITIIITIIIYIIITIMFSSPSNED